MSLMLRLSLIGGFVGLAACSNLFGPNCHTGVEPSLAVTVTDSISGANLAPEAQVQAGDGAFTDTLHLEPAIGVYIGPMERPGTYQITAMHSEYETKSRPGIRVEEGECHVITQEVSIQLARI